MLEPIKIRDIVSEVAKMHLKSTSISGVLSEAVIDSEGREALRITIVIGRDAATRLKADAVLDTLVYIQDRLREAGEERLPIVQYATTEELEAVGDP